MAELNELEHRLTVLRGELALVSREGCTPTQFLKLQRDLVSAWAAVEDHKSRQMPIRFGTATVGENPAEAAGAGPPKDIGTCRR